MQDSSCPTADESCLERARKPGSRRVFSWAETHPVRGVAVGVSEVEAREQREPIEGEPTMFYEDRMVMWISTSIPRLRRSHASPCGASATELHRIAAEAPTPCFTRVPKYASQ